MNVGVVGSGSRSVYVTFLAHLKEIRVRRKEVGYNCGWHTQRIVRIIYKKFSAKLRHPSSDRPQAQLKQHELAIHLFADRR